MNYKKLRSHIDTVNLDILPKVKEDNSNINAFYRADVVGNKRFAQNYGGYPRSDIAEINACTDERMQRTLLADLEDYSPSSNPNAGLTDAEIMLGHRSKYCQVASEQVAWLESQIATRYAQREAAILQAQQAEKQNTDSSVIPNPDVDE